tara:strand:- start:1603 stop:2688 length:1086 start_codon:yes stop_codon:yes gene_type:complete
MNYCWLFHPDLNKFDKRSPESSLIELRLLAKAIDLKILFSTIVKINNIRSSSYFGSGKIEEIANDLNAKNLKNFVIIINDRLTPIQQRNLENKWNCKILDRTSLILEIFGSRAFSKEGTLQVELAHITWQKTRLVRTWTHLERQRGGRGFLGGPGELQIELDRRYLTNRIKKISFELSKIKKTRKLQRNKRKNKYPLVSMIGYTNSGKSTLFNKLTGSKEFVKNMLFATLDPKHRKVTISYENQFILSDTVGFVSNLPTELIDAFKATLDEILYSDLILHVRDISHEDYDSQNNDVLKIVRNIFNYDESQYPDNIIEVINKIDKIEYSHNSIKNTSNKIFVSAKQGNGIKELVKIIVNKLN